MFTYAIGDLQGCSASLDQLLRKLQSEHALDLTRDRLWFAGDLVNRGPDSLGALRRVKGLQERHTGNVVCVQGNHDLYLLAVSLGVVEGKPVDTFQDVLNAPDRDDLLTWLIEQPLMHSEVISGKRHAIVHAGLLPSWSIKQAQSLADELYAVQTGANYKEWFVEMFGGKPTMWADSLQGYDRLRVLVNAFTRLRFCTAAGEMNFNAKGKPSDAPEGLIPWFDVPKRASSDGTIVFGHWSTLGLLLRDNLICLDSGCVWGRALTAVRLEDRTVISVDCPRYSDLVD
jgi:bis(5'-nucleosyl)-tetraphosphatase (symmetrical)